MQRGQHRRLSHMRVDEGARACARTAGLASLHMHAAHTYSSSSRTVRICCCCDVKRSGPARQFNALPWLPGANVLGNF